MKNPEIAGATEEAVVKGIGDYCMKVLKKDLKDVDSKECSTLVSFLQGEIKKGHLANIVFQRASK